jgi:hypothetical protein
VLAGKQQDDVLHAFLTKQIREAIDELTGDQWKAYYRNPSLRATVRMTTQEVRRRSQRTNISAIIKALKRGPLGPAIDLPGKHRKGQGYSIRIIPIPPKK